MFASAASGWPHNALWYHKLMPISCHFQDCKNAPGHVFIVEQRYIKCIGPLAFTFNQIFAEGGAYRVTNRV